MIIILIVLILLVTAALGSILYLGPKMLLLPHRRTPEYYQEKFGFSHPSQIGLQYRDYPFLSKDGLSLSCWLVENETNNGPDRSIIYLHGITDSKVSGLNYARLLIKYCRRIFLVDMRKHGDSEGVYCTYGYHEKNDVVTLIDKIKAEHPKTDIMLLGVSMGGAIAIQTAAIDKRVNRIIAVAPFFDLFSIALDHQARKIGIRSKVLLRLVLKRAEHIAKFYSSEVSPGREIKKIDVPILIVHGESDSSVKREYQEKLKGLNENARLLIIPGAGHVDVLEKGGSGYLEQLVDFIEGRD